MNLVDVIELCERIVLSLSEIIRIFFELLSVEAAEHLDAAFQKINHGGANVIGNERVGNYRIEKSG